MFCCCKFGTLELATFEWPVTLPHCCWPTFAATFLQLAESHFRFRFLIHLCACVFASLFFKVQRNALLLIFRLLLVIAVYHSQKMTNEHLSLISRSNCFCPSCFCFAYSQGRISYWPVKFYPVDNFASNPLFKLFYSLLFYWILTWLVLN